MKKELLNFNRKLSLVFEDDGKPAKTKVEVGEVETTVNGDKVNTEVTIKEEDVELQDNTPELIANLRDKLRVMLDTAKKNAYASKLYAKNVGNIDAIRDSGFYAGQKSILTMVIKELETMVPSSLDSTTIIEPIEENKK